VLIAYHDASGHVNADQDRYVTLAAMVAIEPVWSRFEQDWYAALEELKAPTAPNGKRYFHSNEAYCQRGRYKSWAMVDIKKLHKTLFSIISRYASNKSDRHSELWTMSCTVNKYDYFAVKKNIPLLPDMSHLCLNHCLRCIIQHPEASKGMKLYFDRGSKKSEPYWNEVNDILRRPLSEQPFWGKDVEVPPRVDSNEYAPIQAVDMLAWSANRYYTQGPDKTWGGQFFGLSLATSPLQDYFDRETLQNRYNENGERIPDVIAHAPQIKAPSGTKLSIDGVEIGILRNLVITNQITPSKAISKNSI
jgi:Protein of unknown function (DUF3800)